MTARGVGVRIVEMLDPPGKVVTAETMAEECGVTVRTIYRRIEALRRSGFPIAGERGYGYALQVRPKGSLGVDISLLLLKRFPALTESAGAEDIAAAAAGIGHAMGGLLATVMMHRGLHAGHAVSESIVLTASKQAVSILETIARKEVGL